MEAESMDEITVSLLNRGNRAETESLFDLHRVAQVEEHVEIARKAEGPAERVKMADDSLSNNLVNPAVAYFVAKDAAGNMIGYAELYCPADSDEAWLDDLFVVPPARGHNLAQKLMAAAENQAVSLGKGVLMASTHRRNLSTQAANKRFGFTELSEDEDGLIDYRKSLSRL
jgi:GNAT superfamily N-acetyltransferase